VQDFFPSHQGFFHPAFYKFFGQAILVNRAYEIVSEGEKYVYQIPGYASSTVVRDHARNFDYITFKTDGGLRTVINVHCLWNKSGKGDTPARLEQSQKIIEFTQTLDHPYIIIGDFNLEPNTESLRMLENEGLHNLIIENSIQSTRTLLYTKPGKFADYALVSRGITINEFKVLPDVLSDHSPLYLECA
jgi:endonuclease/exonuclease/phosphatase family metal-dependent hydrolase